MTDPGPVLAAPDDDYRHLVWREVKDNIMWTLGSVAATAPGITYGWWRTREWESGTAAGWVISLCGVGSLLAVVAAWWLVRRAVAGARPPRAPAGDPVGGRRYRRCAGAPGGGVRVDPGRGRGYRVGPPCRRPAASASATWAS